MSDTLDPKTAVWSGNKNMKIPYQTLIEAALIRKKAGNTGYNYHNDQAIIFDNELFPTQTAKGFDSERDWQNVYVQIMMRQSLVVTLPVPVDIDLTTEPAFLYGLDYRLIGADYIPNLFLHIKYSTSGGLWIANHNHTNAVRMTGSIIALRRVVGQGI